jgi:hypothetical protein
MVILKEPDDGFYPKRLYVKVANLIGYLLRGLNPPSIRLRKVCWPDSIWTVTFPNYPIYGQACSSLNGVRQLKRMI